MSYSEITCAIKQYAEAYERLQELQETEPSIPEGDQKTGSIGEFYAYRYLSIAFPDYELTYGSHSEKGWDIHISGVDLKFRSRPSLPIQKHVRYLHSIKAGIYYTLSTSTRRFNLKDSGSLKTIAFLVTSLC